MPVKKEDLIKLQMQETYDELGIKPKWFPQRKAGKNWVMTAYYDARDVQKVLDHVCGIGNWQTGEKELKGNLFREILINVDGEGWIMKSDVGTATKIAAEKGEASDAFKRAGFKWGIFAHVYDMDEILLPVAPDGKSAMTHAGKTLVTGEQMSAYCNGINHGTGMLGRIYMEYRKEIDANPRVYESLKTLGEFLKTVKD